MLIRAIEYKAHLAFLSFLEELESSSSGVWRLAIVDGQYLQKFVKDEFILSLNKITQAAKNMRVFFMDRQDIYIVWQGRIDADALIDLVVRALIKPGLDISSDELVAFKDPRIQINELFLSMSRDYGLKLTADGPVELVAPPVLLPALTPAQKLTFASLQKGRATRKIPTVLIVDDQLFMRKLLHSVLEKDFMVCGAASGLEGWQAFITNAPDVALLDVELNDINGHDLAKKIKELSPETHVVMVTGNNSLEDVVKARANKVDGFITKPFSKKKIIDCLEKFTGPGKGL